MEWELWMEQRNSGKKMSFERLDGPLSSVGTVNVWWAELNVDGV